MLGILVEEILIARGGYSLQETSDLMNDIRYKNKSRINYSSFHYSDLDELISDKGITYSTKKYTHKSDESTTESREAFNGDLFELFKQFILFQKMIEEKK